MIDREEILNAFKLCNEDGVVPEQELSQFIVQACTEVIVELKRIEFSVRINSSYSFCPLDSQTEGQAVRKGATAGDDGKQCHEWVQFRDDGQLAPSAERSETTVRGDRSRFGGNLLFFSCRPLCCYQFTKPIPLFCRHWTASKRSCSKHRP